MFCHQCASREGGAGEGAKGQCVWARRQGESRATERREGGRASVSQRSFAVRRATRVLIEGRSNGAREADEQRRETGQQRESRGCRRQNSARSRRKKGGAYEGGSQVGRTSETCWAWHASSADGVSCIWHTTYLIRTSRRARLGSGILTTQMSTYDMASCSPPLPFFAVAFVVRLGFVAVGSACTNALDVRTPTAHGLRTSGPPSDFALADF